MRELWLPDAAESAVEWVLGTSPKMTIERVAAARAAGRVLVWDWT